MVYDLQMIDITKTEPIFYRNKTRVPGLEGMEDGDEEGG